MLYIVLTFISALSWSTYCHGTSHLGTTNSSAVQWKTCPDDARFDCGSFTVPLDYAHPEVGEATLAIARFNATNQPRLRTIFMNPGGPGGSGVAYLLGSTGHLSIGPYFSTVTGGQYDIVSWDPRGVNQSRPQITCGFTTFDAYQQFFENSTLVAGIEARGNFTDEDDLAAYFAKVNETDATLVETGERCLKNDGEFLKYMGTTAVVRDMVSLSDSIEGPGKLINYWGLSYGTVVGNYFVNMFPERVGRIVIDGMVDTIVYATQPSYKILPASDFSIEAAFEGFAEKCAEAGPQNCAIAQNAPTATSILQYIKGLVDTAYDRHKAGLSNITSFDVRNFIANQLYTPTTWDGELVPQVQALAASFTSQTAVNASTGSETPGSRTGSLTPRQNTNTSNLAIDLTLQGIIAEMVISCVDSIDQQDVTTERLFEEVVRVTHELTPIFGEVVLNAGQQFCHRFPVRAVERFTGPFNHVLANPIIVIGNKADPITPFMNAQKIAAALGKSARLLRQDGFGHSSLAENSDCTQGVVRDYFLNGTLPAIGLVCETDQGLFPPNRTLIAPNPQL